MRRAQRVQCVQCAQRVQCHSLHVIRERSAEPAPDFAARLLCGISFRKLMQLSDASSLNSLAALSAFSLRLLIIFSAVARAAARGLSDLPCIGPVYSVLSAASTHV